METYRLQIVETIVVLILIIAIRFLIRHSINKTLKKFHFSLQRRRLTTKIMNLFIIIMGIVALTAIWSIEKQKLMIFISSVLTILGIAFVAQWSILANITSGLILFFNHPMKIGDHIKVLEKDFIIEGKINDITFFFVHLLTSEGEQITIPNSIVLQKNIAVSHPEKIPDKKTKPGTSKTKKPSEVQ
ncbi:mechanosensitive ion channel domain-containing protein [Sunxiuqinia elliptica]|uniref:Mechanosensitive ion channel n=1 Tax=Sunxiuqinia elliptica TaxID=655355 RepID=A0A1I2KBW4_9BACT|nr:mechanosensitive ion channel domain-containing protein [Sunxiuqinia elliptica]TDN96297.1 mechanosensitive ion channel-like protein [Sunxiuqinia elliptica]TDO68008.1 mechanosensitive ion channel-like protein [Sunxiuqinia elliptica]SFF62426.1 Mechanosensitive ion channel [Sunxiuqinia elliptica]